MKLFVVSDIHSFYTPLIKALEAAGYDKNNNERLQRQNGLFCRRLWFLCLCKVLLLQNMRKQYLEQQIVQ
mgnify:CR=1 FL=1